MKILVCGSRDWRDKATVHRALLMCEERYGEYHLIHGACRGADIIAGELALAAEMVVTAVPAKWGKHGKKAGPIRNDYMLKRGRPSLVLAFHQNIRESRGTAHMVKIAEDAGISVVVISGSSSLNTLGEDLP